MSQGKLASIVSPRTIRVITGVPSYIKKGPVTKYSSVEIDAVNFQFFGVKIT